MNVDININGYAELIDFGDVMNIFDDLDNLRHEYDFFYQFFELFINDFNRFTLAEQLFNDGLSWNLHNFSLRRQKYLFFSKDLLDNLISELDFDLFDNLFDFLSGGFNLCGNLPNSFNRFDLLHDGSF